MLMSLLVIRLARRGERLHVRALKDECHPTDAMAMQVVVLQDKDALLGDTVHLLHHILLHDNLLRSPLRSPLRNLLRNLPHQVNREEVEDYVVLWLRVILTNEVLTLVVPPMRVY